ncbi:MAG: N-acetylmuramoyl-L-alanine amidase [Candidatus Krumholzibacteriia bacterium]
MPAGALFPLTTVFLLVCLAVPGTATARPDGVRVERIRHFSGPEHTRVVLDLSGPPSYEVRQVASPHRLAINVAGARFALAATVPVGDGIVERVRCNAGTARAQVVLDLARPARHECFVLGPAAGRPHRLVIDVFRTAAATAPPADRPAATSSAGPASGPPLPERPFVVVIDPGHGGLDPGAIRAGLREKDVVLAVALEMKRLLDDLPGYRAVLTRDGDRYPSLARRVAVAREAQGDLFLSIHCNTHRREAVAGMEVYFLSLQGATDREAQELADAENAAHLVGLAPGEPRSELVVNILMDLRKTRVLRESQRLCLDLLETAAGSEIVGARRVKQARFQVLRNLAMPSALVELAYLSNVSDRKLLASADGRRQLAALLVDGIRRHREGEQPLVASASVPPARGAILAAAGGGARGRSGWSHAYRVRQGDNLWRLARLHGTTIDEIARHNGLHTSHLQEGQLLTLPEGD